ncbi:hypothetical protein ACIGO8_16575 [Streptomyces sp. NPDC053493]|uniref:hypothetical protein n=1 Tax=Streptomyces sp. NPDC053493 TaxID=3365705 RepID=UPI0037D131F7
MSFDQEWASARTAGAKGAVADLSVDQDRLGALGSAAYALHGRLTKDGNHAGAETAVAGADLTRNGFRTGAALIAVHEAWGSQLRTLLDACAHISNHLDYSAASHAREEEDIRTALAVSQIDRYLK